jgi:hypothetical protein
VKREREEGRRKSHRVERLCKVQRRAGGGRCDESTANLPLVSAWLQSFRRFFLGRVKVGADHRLDAFGLPDLVDELPNGPFDEEVFVGGFGVQAVSLFLIQLAFRDNILVRMMALSSTSRVVLIIVVPSPSSKKFECARRKFDARQVAVISEGQRLSTSERSTAKIHETKSSQKVRTSALTLVW